jgi:hypothetical protein
VRFGSLILNSLVESNMLATPTVLIDDVVLFWLIGGLLNDYAQCR